VIRPSLFVWFTVVGGLLPSFTPAFAQETPKTLAKRPDLAFKGVYFTVSDERPLSTVRASYGDFTLDGPKEDTLKPLPSGVRAVAYDPEGKQLYGLGQHEVYQLDLANGTKTELKVEGDGVEKLSWPCGLAFDSKRQRLLVASFGGGGHLYAFAPKEKRWSQLTELKHLCSAGLAYDAKADCLWTLHRSLHPGSKPVLAKMNAHGAHISDVKLPDELFPKPADKDQLPINFHGPVQLLAQDGHLIIQTDALLALVDAQAEVVTVTWRKKK
jgi:hypothetical protein